MRRRRGAGWPQAGHTAGSVAVVKERVSSKVSPQVLHWKSYLGMNGILGWKERGARWREDDLPQWYRAPPGSGLRSACLMGRELGISGIPPLPESHRYDIIGEQMFRSR